MNNRKDHSSITPESVLASVKEMFAKSQKKTQAELAKSRTNFEKEMEQSRAEFDRRMKDAEQERKASVAEIDRLLKDLAKQVGGTSNTQGDFAEEYFFNSIDKDKEHLFGEEFHTIEKNRQRKIKNGICDEYDILLVNGEAIGIVEIKFKAQQDDIPKTLKKVSTFRANFPEYKNHRLYLGLAAMSFAKGVEDKSTEEGIAIIKQVGDTMVVNDKHIKVF
jgi:ElaB/YqjD/DUF883 family membrane-anchored ribosome-binding protein